MTFVIRALHSSMVEFRMGEKGYEERLSPYRSFQ